MGRRSTEAQPSVTKALAVAHCAASPYHTSRNKFFQFVVILVSRGRLSSRFPNRVNVPSRNPTTHRLSWQDQDGSTTYMLEEVVLVRPSVAQWQVSLGRALGKPRSLAGRSGGFWRPICGATAPFTGHEEIEVHWQGKLDCRDCVRVSGQPPIDPATRPFPNPFPWRIAT